MTDTDATSRTMILPCLHGMKANHAKSIDFLPLTEEGVIVVLLMFLRRDYESSEEYDRASEDDSLCEVDPRDLNVDDCKTKDQHDQGKAIVENGLKIRSAFGLVLHLGVADELQVVQERIPIV